MQKIDYTELQNESEIDCVCRFLHAFNESHKSQFDNPEKNKGQYGLEVDVTCTDSGANKVLKIQVKTADPRIREELGKSKVIPLSVRPLILRDHNQAIIGIIQNIYKVEEKYTQQNKIMSDIVLLLDEIMEPSELILQKIKARITRTIFKEIWLITRNSRGYRII